MPYLHLYDTPKEGENNSYCDTVTEKIEPTQLNLDYLCIYFYLTPKAAIVCGQL